MEDKYKKTEDCISRFKNGKERYHKSPTFNRVVQMLVRDMDPYDIIDQLCLAIDDQNNAFEQYMINSDFRPIVSNITQKDK